MENNQKKHSFLSALFFAKEISGISSGREKNHFLNRFNKFSDGIMKSLAYTSARTIGFFFLSFGILSLLMNLLKYYFAENPIVELTTLIICAAFVLVGLPLIFVEKPLCIMLQDFVITDYIFFEFFSIKRMRRDEKIKTIPTLVAIIVGLLLAILAFLLGVEPVLLVFGLLIFAIVSFVSPEFPFLFIVLILPYTSLFPNPDFILSGLLILTLISFFRKVRLGKRVYVFGISDVLIFLFALIIFIFGIVGKGEIAANKNLIYFVFSLAYIPTSNRIVNRRLADCAVEAVLASATPVAAYSLIVHILRLMGVSTVSYDAIGSGVAVASLLLVATAFALFYIPHKKGAKKAVTITELILYLLSLLTSSIVPVLIVLPIFFVAFAIVFRLRSSKIWVILLFLLPGVVFLLPADMLYSISSFFSMELTLPEMRQQLVYSIEIFFKNAFLGVDYTADSTLMFVNTPIVIGLRFGIFAVVIIALILLLRLRQFSLYDGYLRSSSSLLRLSNMTFLAMMALLMLGWFADVSMDMSVYALFFLVFGMSTASLRISKNEYEDRQRYFGDNRRVDSSDADITLKKWY